MLPARTAAASMQRLAHERQCRLLQLPSPPLTRTARSSRIYLSLVGRRAVGLPRTLLGTLTAAAASGPLSTPSRPGMRIVRSRPRLMNLLIVSPSLGLVCLPDIEVYYVRHLLRVTNFAHQTSGLPLSRERERIRKRAKLRRVLRGPALPLTAPPLRLTLTHRTDHRRCGHDRGDGHRRLSKDRGGLLRLSRRQPWRPRHSWVRYRQLRVQSVQLHPRRHPDRIPKGGTIHLMCDLCDLRVHVCVFRVYMCIYVRLHLRATTERG